MTDKFVAMMQEQERHRVEVARWERNQGRINGAEELEKCAADWRSMREAWVAMVEALKSAKIMIEGGIEHEFRKTKAGDDVRAALTKARAQ